MLMKDNRKNMATIIVSKMNSKPEEEMHMSKEKEGAESEVSQHEMAAEEILQAIERKDARMLADALQAFYEMCAHQEEPEY